MTQSENNAVVVSVVLFGKKSPHEVRTELRHSATARPFEIKVAIVLPGLGPPLQGALAQACARRCVGGSHAIRNPDFTLRGDDSIGGGFSVDSISFLIERIKFCEQSRHRIRHPAISYDGKCH
jgi:hypothetical protein